MARCLLIYGATGYTGRLIVSAARKRGLIPILCGRDKEKLRSLASSTNLDFRNARLDDPEELDRSLRGVDIVLNAAGPFSSTAAPMMAACLRAKAHYLDVAGEVAVLEAASRLGSSAMSLGLMVMPGAGFDVVPSDCLLAYVARRCPGARRLFLGVSGLTLLSRGSAKTMIEQLDEPVWVRRGGILERVPPASLERSFDYGDGPRPSIVTSWGDVASAYFSTGVPDITAFFEATTAVRMHSSLTRLFGWAVPYTPWKALLGMYADLLPDGPSDEDRLRGRAVLVAEAENGDGQSIRARLGSPEAYTLTAISAVAIAERVLAGDIQPGFQTPSRVYGPDLVLSFPGVTREDL